MRVALGDYLLGAGMLAIVVGACAAAAAATVRRLLAGAPWEVRLTGGGTVFTLLLAGCHALPLALGRLDRVSVLLLAVLVGVGAVVALRRGRPSPARDPNDDRPEPRGRAGWPLVVGGVVLVGWLIGYLRTRAAVAVTHDDALIFHYPVVARWIQEGTLWQAVEYVPGFANGLYPHTGDLVALAVVLPFGQDFLLRLVFIPWIGLSALAVAATARELRVPWGPAGLVGLTVVAMPRLLYSATDAALVDIVLVAAFSTGLLFLLRHHRTRARRDLGLAAASLGLAFGTKWYGPPGVAGLLVVWGAWRLHAERRLGTVARDLALVGAGAVAVGGLWLVRNVVVAGNPVFPKEVSAFGVVLFDAPPTPLRDSVSFTVADYLTDAQIWVERLLPGWWDGLGPGGVLLLAAVPVVIVAASRARRPTDPRIGFLCSAAILLLAVYAVTPDSAAGPQGEPLLVRQNVRYALPALLCAAPLLAWLATRPRTGRRAVEVALLATAIAGARLATHLDLAWWTLGILVAAAAWLLRRPAQKAASRLTAEPFPAVACGLVALVLLGAVGRDLQKRHAQGRYVAQPTTVAAAWIQTRLPAGADIGIAGEPRQGRISPIYPAFGPRLGNEVVFVGRFDRGLLRSHPDAASFREHVRRERFDALLVHRPRSGPLPEERWALQAGYRHVIDEHPVALLCLPTSSACRAP